MMCSWASVIALIFVVLVVELTITVTIVVIFELVESRGEVLHGLFLGFQLSHFVTKCLQLLLELRVRGFRWLSAAARHLIWLLQRERPTFTVFVSLIGNEPQSLNVRSESRTAPSRQRVKVADASFDLFEILVVYTVCAVGKFRSTSAHHLRKLR